MNVRLSNIRRFMEKLELDAVVVSKPENRVYFSGFTGSSGMLLIAKEQAKLITDFRYVEQAVEQASIFEVVKHEQSILAVVAEEIKKCGAFKIGFEGDFFTYNEFSMLAQLLHGYKLRPLGLDELRTIKDETELTQMKKAVEISDMAFSHILSVLRPGISELEIAAELEHTMRKLGSEKPAFDTIVASGVRGSLPHGIATKKLIAAGDFVTMDFGAVYKGYHSDITRTVCVGRASEKQRHIYNVVLRAQLLGVESVRPGVSGKKADEQVRRFLADAGYGQFFGHGLGHGVGLAIHELPRLSPSSACDSLTENMLVTVEPGVYLPDWGGVRIEDTVLVTANGREILTKSSKQLVEIE